MKYFLPDKSYTTGFRFKQLYPNTPYWKKLGMAGKPHLGTDLLCNGIQGIATLSGVGKYVYGSGAGHQLHFYPSGTNDLIRFLHLRSRETTKTGAIKPGDRVFITANSGTQTNAPHLHCDIWNLSYGPLNIYNINGFKSPETYNWGSINLSREIVMPEFVKRGTSPALYHMIAGKWWPVGNIWEDLKKQYPSIEKDIVTLSPADFDKYPVVGDKLGMFKGQ